MKTFLSVSLLVAVSGHQDAGDFQRWAKNKALESCFGEENMKVWTVEVKKARAKCSQQDAPELLLPEFRAPYKTVNALLEASQDTENSDMQMMFNMFRFMHKMQMSQNNYQQQNSYNQYRPYSQDYDMSDNMPMPMKWMMKMMMKNNMENADNYDVMKSRSNNPMDSRLDKIESLIKHAFNNKMNKGQNYMKNSQHNKQGMYGDMFDMKNSDLDFSSLFSQRQRHARAAGNSLDLGDRLVEKLQRQKQEMEEKVGNLTCILKEVNVLDASNDISVLGMKKDLEKYELPSAWFKDNYEALIDTCHEMATTLPAELNDGHIVEGEFGSVNMAQVKAFMNCCHKGKAKLCMNQDTKQKIEQNFGPTADILKQAGLTENQLFPLVQDLLHGQESQFEDLF